MAIGETSANLLFFIVTTLLFFYEASHRQHAMFHDHLRQYIYLTIGITLVLVNSLVTDTLLDNLALQDPTNKDETKFCHKVMPDHMDQCNPYLSPLPLLKLTAQVACMYIFVLFKTPKDCFICYSKATNIKYSMFQYVRFVYTEQYLTVQRNANLLEKLQGLSSKNVLLADLDIDDYLDPKRTIERYTLGVDMDYMVARLGGSIVMQETETYLGVIEEEEDGTTFFDSMLDNSINAGKQRIGSRKSSNQRPGLR